MAAPVAVAAALGAAFTARASLPLVVCDIDNVLAWMAEAACIAVNARFGASYLVSGITAYPVSSLMRPEEAGWLASHITRDPWVLNLAPDHEAIRALGVIRDAGHRVIISSDRPARCADATVRWLDYWEVPRDGVRLDGPGSKQAALAACGPSNPGVLIDDDPAKWLTVARAGVQVWCPSRPWTPAGRSYPNVRVFGSWAELPGWLSLPGQVL